MKFTSLRAARNYWITGILISAIGIVLARVLAPQFTTSARTILKALGQLLAVVGLVIISVGVSRRVSVDEKDKA